MSRLLKSLEKSIKHTNPWEYFTFGQCLSLEQIDEIKNAEIDRSNYLHDGTRSGYKEGVAKQNHNFREYITKDNYSKYPELKKFIDELRTESVREIIADMVNNKDKFKNAYIRLEVLKDTQGFWLKPHCDWIEKLISSLIYINDTDEDKSLGTDLYNENKELVFTVPFLHNFGYIFHGPNKWHGMESGKKIKVARRGIQVNYVTFKTDWKV